MYVSNLRSGESVTWYTTDETIDTLITYIFGLLGLDKTDLNVTDTGFYLDRDESLMVMGITGPWGSGLTVWGFKPAGTERINNAISTEWDAMMAAMSTGSYVGNPARSKYAVIAGGALTPDWEGSPAIDYINDSVPVHLWSFMRD
jgi:hypothetical protein